MSTTCHNHSKIDQLIGQAQQLVTTYTAAAGVAAPSTLLAQIVVGLAQQLKACCETAAEKREEAKVA